MRLAPVDLIGGFNEDDAKTWASLDPVNWIPEMAEGLNRTRIKLADAPGLRALLTLGVEPGRGLRNVQGRLFAVTGNVLYEVKPNFTFVNRGTIPGVGRVGMQHNQRGAGNELLITNGSAGYVFDTALNTLVKITDPGYPGGHSPDFLDGYLFEVEPYGRFFFHSELTKAKEYNTLDRYQSESSPDRLVTGRVNQQEYVAFNETTTEFFYNSGTTTGTFKSKRISMDRGCAGRYTVARMDNSLLWLGNDGVFYRLNGYSAQPISTGAVEKAILGYNWSQCFSMTFESKHHKIVYWTFPDGKTFGYDVITGLWHRRESFGLNRWRINAIVEWNGLRVANDYTNGNVYAVDWGVSYEASDPLERSIKTPIMHDDQNPMTVIRLDLLFDTGAKDQTLEAPTGVELVTIFGMESPAGGVAIDPDAVFNAALSGALGVSVIGYYAGGAPYVYPPVVAPAEVDLSGVAYVGVTPITLTTGNEAAGAGNWWASAGDCAEIPFGASYVVISYHSGGPAVLAHGLIYKTGAS
jgi:Phage stabilisation protein